MAFNPFTSFQKNKKFWMAVVLLLCMVTFVLCTGVQGDLGDRLIRTFGGRRGNVLAHLDDSAIYSTELYELKQQREIANDFMRQLTEISLKNAGAKQRELQTVAAGKTDFKKSIEAKQAISQLAQVSDILDQRLRQKRYFGSGTKLEELLDFKIWQHEANRLGVHLEQKHVYDMYFQEVFSHLTGAHQVAQGLYASVRRNHSYVTDAMIWRAVGEEFRVRIAQLALAKVHDIQNPNDGPMRYALAPGAMWDLYKQERSAIEVSMLPVHVEDFFKDVPAPKDSDLEAIFDAHRKDPFDPTSDSPGFEIPSRIQVAYVTADPKSPRFLNLGKLVVQMRATPPVLAPLAGTLPLVGEYVGRTQIFRSIYQANYDRTKEKPDQRLRFATGGLGSGDVYTQIAWGLARQHPEAAAAVVGAYAQSAIAPGMSPVVAAVAVPSAFLPTAHRKHAAELQAAREADGVERAPIYSTLVGAGASGTPFPTALMLTALSDGLFNDIVPFWNFPTYMPALVAESEIASAFERNESSKFVNSSMNKLRAELDTVSGVKGSVEARLKHWAPQLGLEVVQTKDYFDRFGIDLAPELQAFRQVYEKSYPLVNFLENRDLNPTTELKEDEFYKLFFDPSETFSIASGNQGGGTHSVRAWPPAVTPKNVGKIAQSSKRSMFFPQIAPDLQRLIMEADPNRQNLEVNLFEKADQPFLFWKADEKRGGPPAKIDEVRDRVVAAYKTQEARDKYALARAREIAQQLLKAAPGQHGPILSFQDRTRPLIELKDVAPWQATSEMPPIGYSPYQLPKGLVRYARPEMSEQLVKLRDLDKPIQLGQKDTKELDELNKELLETAKKLEKTDKVQILTNKPRTIYYVTFATKDPRSPSLSDFTFAWMRAYNYNQQLNRPVRGDDHLVEQLQSEAGKMYYRQVMESLRQRLRLKISETEDRKQFDSSEG